LEREIIIIFFGTPVFVIEPKINTERCSRKWLKGTPEKRVNTRGGIEVFEFPLSPASKSQFQRMTVGLFYSLFRKTIEMPLSS